MATRYWVAGSTDLAVGWASLATGDTLIAGAGGDKPTAGLDQSAKDFAGVTIAPNCGVQYGTEDEPFKFECTAGVAFMAGRADQRWAPGAGKTHAKVVHRPALPGVRLIHSDGTATLVEVAEGGVYRALGTLALTTLYGLAGSSSYIIYSATAITTLHAYGRVQSERVCTTANIYQGADVSQVKGDQTWGTVNQQGGIFRPKGGTITTYTGGAGVLDLSGLERDLTLTNSTMHAGLKVIPPPGAGGVGPRLILTNPTTFRGGSVEGYPS